MIEILEKEVHGFDVITPGNQVCQECKGTITAGSLARKIEKTIGIAKISDWYHLPACFPQKRNAGKTTPAKKPKLKRRWTGIKIKELSAPK